jgi:hypothetical protein
MSNYEERFDAAAYVRYRAQQTSPAPISISPLPERCIPAGFCKRCGGIIKNGWWHQNVCVSPREVQS